MQFLEYLSANKRDEALFWGKSYGERRLID